MGFHINEYLMVYVSGELNGLFLCWVTVRFQSYTNIRLHSCQDKDVENNALLLARMYSTKISDYSGVNRS